MNWKVFLLVEANGNTALYYGQNSSYSQPPKIGTGVAIYEMLAYIFNDPSTLSYEAKFNGIELSFFKGNYKIYNTQALSEISLTNENPDMFFNYMIFNEFAQGKEEIFSNEWQGKLCTEAAIDAVLNELAKSKITSADKTCFVFISDTPSVFSDMLNYTPLQNLLPDLSVFCLNQKSVVNAARLLSSFMTDKCKMRIFDYASIQNNMAQVIEAYQQKNPESKYKTQDLVRFSVENKCGTAYSLYDAVKIVFQSTSSYSR